ncbi:cobalamin-binding protein [Methylotenera sp.]|uniref:cobalamin-binding protein n=1 Tax=Methylotenera sp. TaxID=2051956 RepID=UPI002488AB12|nr:cobalamin-binding protein [Methylotenera sp.]MDI1363132.1 cobalamin-binding protein [Methylotenera sp.]
MRYPKRIVCLTTEPTEVLYLLGEQDRIVGISGYTTHPAIARKEKPKVSAFTSAKIDKILALQPDLVIGFSNLQADIAASLIRAGVEVHIFNQRSVAQVLNMIAVTGALVGATEKAAQLIATLEKILDEAQKTASKFTIKPKVYFEEWDDPMMCSIRWAMELIELAGGADCFPELSHFHSAKDRIVTPQQVVERQPDIIIGSWCGKKFQPEQVMTRKGWEDLPAVKHGFVREIKSADILQPGPSLITHGLKQIQAIIQEWQIFQARSV